ncbi:MAG: hypothetical protein V4596_02220 [Bdellovibrionota bacterium]
MKIFFILTLLTLTIAANATIPNLSGEYTLNIAKEGCPNNVKISQIQNDLTVDTGVCVGCERYYSEINNGTESHNDDFGVSTQTKSVFKNNVLSDYSRPCQGVIFKKCGDWTLNSTLAILEEGTLEVATPNNASKYDLAGFPVGEKCYYSK